MPPFGVQRDIFLAGQGDEDARARLREKGRRGGVMSARSRRNKTASPSPRSTNELWDVWDELRA